MAQLAAFQRFGGVIAIAVLAGGCAAAPTSPPSAGVSPAPLSISTSAVVATPAPTVAPTPAGTPVPAGWHTAPIQPWFATVEFTDVVWSGARFVAAVSGPGDGGTFADSTDGVTWNLQTAGDPAWRPDHVAAGPAGVVATGVIGAKLASWSSADGLTWKATADAFPLPSLGDDTVYVDDVIARADGWLAVGRREPSCEVDCGTNPVRAYSWTSSDGLTWMRAADQTSLKGAGMSSVVATASGFVAVGVGSSHPAIWTSTDATTWVRVPDAPVLHEAAQKSGTLSAAATGVVVTGDGTIAMVGSAFAQNFCPTGIAANLCPGARAWWSTNGTTWTRATVDLPIDGQIFSVAAAPNGLVAVGPSDACLGGIWSSVDGKSWGCDGTDPSFTGFGPYAAAASSTIEVAVGLTSVGWDSSGDLGMPGSIWVKTLP
jgi:hypothetical protein